MRVRMLTSVAGTRDGKAYCHEAGKEYDLPSDVAREYVSRPEAMPRAEAVAEVPSGRRQSSRRETRA
jgi:hypothetical protein